MLKKNKINNVPSEKKKVIHEPTKYHFETKISGAWGATSKLTLKFKLA